MGLRSIPVDCHDDSCYNSGIESKTLERQKDSVYEDSKGLARDGRGGWAKGSEP